MATAEAKIIGLVNGEPAELRFSVDLTAESIDIEAIDGLKIKPGGVLSIDIADFEEAMKIVYYGSSREITQISMKTDANDAIALSKLASPTPPEES